MGHSDYCCMDSSFPKSCISSRVAFSPVAFAPSPPLPMLIPGQLWSQALVHLYNFNRVTHRRRGRRALQHRRLRGHNYVSLPVLMPNMSPLHQLVSLRKAIGK